MHRLQESVQSVSAVYKELHHYTTASGLHGILTSQSLWATHISYLNDDEEHIGFFQRRLPNLLLSPISNAVNSLHKTPLGKSQIEKLGGIAKCVADLHRDLLKSITETTLKFNQPFVASFCGAVSDQTQNDGLLSQWRGYGPDGGYAIAFDTQGLDEKFARESANFLYQHFHWGDVHYHDPAQPEKRFPEQLKWENDLQVSIEHFVQSQNRKDLEPLILAITPLSVLHKHAGFREENEVRIVAIPANDELRKVAIAKRITRPQKPILHLQKGGVLVPYISMFNGSTIQPSARLPIKRIVVGPHIDKLKRKQAVESLLTQLNLAVPVVASDIPYRGR